MRTTRRLIVLLLLGSAAAVWASPRPVCSTIVHDAQDPRLKGGPDGVGGIPKSTAPKPGPTGPTGPIKTPTVGQVLDASTYQPIAGVLLVVTAPSGAIAGLAITNDDGL